MIYSIIFCSQVQLGTKIRLYLLQKSQNLLYLICYQSNPLFHTVVATFRWYLCTIIWEFQITTFDMTAHYCACQSSVSSGALVVAAAVYVYILELPYSSRPAKNGHFS